MFEEWYEQNIDEITAFGQNATVVQTKNQLIRRISEDMEDGFADAKSRHANVVSNISMTTASRELVDDLRAPLATIELKVQAVENNVVEL